MSDLSDIEFDEMANSPFVEPTLEELLQPDAGRTPATQTLEGIKAMNLPKITFDEANAALIRSGVYRDAFVADAEHSCCLPNNVWSMLTDGDEIITWVFVDELGRYCVVPEATEGTNDQEAQAFIRILEADLEALRRGKQGPVTERVRALAAAAAPAPHAAHVKAWEAHRGNS